MAKQITIDLNAEPDLKELTAECSPGEKLKLEVSIRAKDDQTLTVVIDEAEKMDSEGDDEEMDDEEDSELSSDGSDSKMADMKSGPKPPKGMLGGKY